MGKERTKLSASRVKKLQECSWKYYCSYILKLPDKSNSGSKRGSIVHDLFELLGKPKWLIYAKSLLADFNLEKFPLIIRFIRIKCYQYELEPLEMDAKSKKSNLGLIYDMIKVGLECGFFAEDNEKIIDSEFRFDIANKEPEYRMTGFIDRILFNEETKELKISDFKSSKIKFPEKELATYLQAMMYSLAAYKLKEEKKLPEFKKVIVQFIFLRFASNPYQTLEFTNEQLGGLQHFLAYINDVIDNFDIENAQSDFALHDSSKSWLCGRGSFQCPYKKPFEYWSLIDKAGNPKTSLSKEDFEEKSHKIKLEDGDKWKLRNYEGCLAHKDSDKDFLDI